MSGVAGAGNGSGSHGVAWIISQIRLASLFDTCHPVVTLQTGPIFGMFVKIQSLPVITILASGLRFSKVRRNLYALLENTCPSHLDCRCADRPALCTRPGLHQYRSRAGLSVWLLRFRPIQLRPIWVLRSRVV